MFGLKTGRVGTLGRIAGSGGRPTLDLPFTGGSADSRLTTTRAAGGATYYDQTGTLQLANANTPRIDYGPGVVTNPTAVTNWTLQSGTPNGSAPWGNRNSPTMTSGQLAPDGTSTAYLFAYGSTTNTIYDVYQDIINVGVEQTGAFYTSSVYAKAAGNNWLHLQIWNFFSPGSGLEAWFNLQTGVLGSTGTNGGASSVSSTITSVGNGWYRCSLSGILQTLAGRLTVEQNFRLSQANGDSGTTGVIGNGTLIWHPQLEVASTASAYLPTTATTSTVGATALGLLIEESRVNSIRNPRFEGAVVGTPGTYPTDMTESHNTGLTPNVIGFGYENGIPYWDIQLSGTATAGQNNIFFENANISAGNNQVWTESAYMRVVAGSLTNVSAIVLGINDDVAGGNGIALVPSGSALGSQRFTYTRTLSATATVIVNAFMQFNLAAGAVNITLRIGAPQIELGAFATSPILPAIGTPAATTRASDAVTMPIGAWYNPVVSSMAVESLLPTVSLVLQGLLLIDDGTTSNRIILRNSSGVASVASVVSGSPTINLTGSAITAGSVFKVAGQVSSNSSAVEYNGGAPVTAAGGAIPSGLTTVRLGQNSVGAAFANGYIRRVRYWPRALSNSDLIRYTT